MAVRARVRILRIFQKKSDILGYQLPDHSHVDAVDMIASMYSGNEKPTIREHRYDRGGKSMCVKM